MLFILFNISFLLEIENKTATTFFHSQYWNNRSETIIFFKKINDLGIRRFFIGVFPKNYKNMHTQLIKVMERKHIFRKVLSYIWILILSFHFCAKIIHNKCIFQIYQKVHQLGIDINGPVFLWSNFGVKLMAYRIFIKILLLIQPLWRILN